jgi:hypothetical protein
MTTVGVGPLAASLADRIGSNRSTSSASQEKSYSLLSLPKDYDCAFR